MCMFRLGHSKLNIDGHRNRMAIDVEVQPELIFKIA